MNRHKSHFLSVIRILSNRISNFSTKMASTTKTLTELNFDNRVLKILPIDIEKENYTRTVNNACFSLVKPSPLLNPRLVCFSESALRLIDLDSNLIDDYFVNCFAGNEILVGSEPASHCYCGHQFGTFAGQLGDGAAIYLGEIVNTKNDHWELQLKGAGLTPYSRDADGRKVLRSSVREFLCSEAMHHLGIPTTRAATCIIGDDKVLRDMFYDGNPKMENCAVISRLAPTFIRFGSFEIFKTRDLDSGRVGPSVGRTDILTTLTDFVIETLFPSINSSDISQTEKYKLFYKEVVIRTAKLVALWQTVGFCHGVLNTDNMSILGLTIDYGPFGFIERFHPDHIPNTSDTDGRYRFKKQPEVCCWNLLKFAEALAPLVPIEELKDILSDNYFLEYKNEFMKKMRCKLGLFKVIDESDNENSITDELLVKKFLDTMDKVGADYTNCFRALSKLSVTSSSDHEESFSMIKEELIKQSSTHEEMMQFYQGYVSSPMVYMRLILMQNFNERLQNDEKMIDVLLNLENYQQLKDTDPEDFRNEVEQNWNTWLEMYVERLNYETCDIENESDIQTFEEKRKRMMNENNPCYILRNYLAEDAIKKSENGDFSEVKLLLKALQDPYNPKAEFTKYSRKPSKSACSLRVSCSS